VRIPSLQSCRIRRSALMRAGLRAVLSSDPAIAVVGEAEDGLALPWTGP
jgi:chemotaxis response regulator CheB